MEPEESNKNTDQNQPQTEAIQAKPKKRRWGCIIAIPLIIVVVFLLSKGVKYVNQQADTTKDGPAGPAKNYTYPAPTSQALNRTIDCKNDIRKFKLNNLSALCLNLYKTSPEDLQSKISAGTYDDIVLYGQNIIFDVATNINKPTDFGFRIYNTAKFTDLITLPKLMQLYGVEDLSYIGKDFVPYPALYFEVKNQADVNKSCHSEFNIGGCSEFGQQMVLLDDSISSSEQKSRSRSWSRNETDDHLFYRETIPTDCYVSHVINHETGHTLLWARKHYIQGISLMGNFNSAPKWFSEEQAGMTEVAGMQWVCGADTVSDVTGTFADKVPGADFMKFQSTYPTLGVGGGSPNNDCEKAIMTGFYRYLSGGNIEDRMPALMSDLREKFQIKDYMADDKNFASLILQYLNNDPKEREFFNSHGCGI